MNLGLDTLTDDQLVELARAIATEMVTRNPAVADAAQAAIRDEIAKAARSQDNQWTKKKWLATMVKQHVGDDCTLTVWRNDGHTVTRVYLDKNGSDRRGRDSIKWCLHVTGDNRHPPGTLTKDEGSRASSAAKGSVIKIICRHAIAAYAAVKIDCDQAAATKYDIPPLPADFTAAIEKIAAKKAAEAARDAYQATAKAPIFAPVEAAEKEALNAHGKSNRFSLPADVQADLDARYAAARTQLAAIMAAYDAENGAAE